MLRALYTAVFYLALPAVLVRLWWRGRRSPAYRQRWSERLGRVTADADSPLWIHAVSVGETVAIAPLVELLLQRHPELPILLTTMTPTGAERVQALFGERVRHCYCPWDLPHALARFHRRIRPRGLVIVETELWPNLIKSCAERQVPVLVANARLSARSARGYRRFGGLTRPMLQRLHRVVAQHHADGERFVELGLPPDRLSVSGSIKFDIEIRQEWQDAGQRLRRSWGEARPVLVAGSTHEGEDSLLFDALKTLRSRHPNLLLVLVPRHPERFDSVYQQCLDAGLAAARHSLSEPVGEAVAVYLGDTMGELMAFYAAADIAYVGGSLVPRGGHNPLEPAALGKPVLMGPEVFNFQSICDELETAGGLERVPDEAALASQLERLLSDEALRLERGEAARNFVAQNRGALERLYGEVEAMLVRAPVGARSAREK
ncbi:3-deoxy-D-manno-octulosonic acid transferase [Marinobacterium nitratireducens]|uniref:3-deoxy-D-manno-octulosonic acid transferase n=1 Tax=Marinobacterium nitratireducens TaxID=518897 RepID=A0A917ZB19_9GAMM|nr:lipid IV(A) 3-deoxy-D-manno-octulosonic acid transferase [Marinobacterium nitratireducens]GGO78036.1 3-deoxy-D-manno-octulosonic acid transferase [Marinobacterium nitratireducens]